MWTKAQVAAFQRARALSQKWQPALDRLSEMAKVSPQFAERIQELKTRADNAAQLAELALQIDSTGQRG